MTELSLFDQTYTIAGGGRDTVTAFSSQTPAGANWTINAGVSLYAGADVYQNTHTLFRIEDMKDSKYVAAFALSEDFWVCNHCYQKIPMSASLGGDMTLTFNITNKDTTTETYEVVIDAFYWN